MAKRPKRLKSLGEDDYLLIRETKRKNLKELDEDELIDLHQRIRRARNKYVGVYRRTGAQKVASKKARGHAKSANQRNHARAEAFEDALAKVSLRLSTVAAQAALELKEERLDRARSSSPSFADLPDGGKVGAGASAATGKTSGGRMRVDATRQSPGRKKYEASSRAAGKRRQGKKDKRP
ncbi:MAG TPA: hypothetical protein VIW24_17925 [Aldersonia sp.]